MDPALFLPLFAALAYALSVLCGRRLGQSQSAAAMALSATVVYVFAGGAMALALAGTPPPAESDASIKFLLNRYLRMLLIQGARAILLRPASWVKHCFGLWLAAAARRLHRNVLAVALANKLARIAWTVLAQGRRYEARVESRVEPATA